MCIKHISLFQRQMGLGVGGGLNDQFLLSLGCIFSACITGNTSMIIMDQ